MNIIQQYTAAFERCYPQAAMTIKGRMHPSAGLQFVVSIDGSAGDPMSENDIRGAIARFHQHGRPVNKRGLPCNL